MTPDERAARVLAVVDAARRLADARDPLGAEARRVLPAVTGLSPEGVALALDRHLETEVSPADLRSLLERAGSAPRVYVVLSANVFVGAVRAIALAVACAPEVVVRPSRRESVVAPLVARALAERTPPVAISIAQEAAPRAGDELHVYGRDETIAELRRGAPPGVVVRGHASGLGVAVVESGCELDAAAEALSWDIVPFDQQGCLSPRLAVVEEHLALAFARALAAALDRRAAEVPRGEVSREAATAIGLWRDAQTLAGPVFPGASSIVALRERPGALTVPPPCRNVLVAAVASAAEASALLAPLARSITTVGASGGGPLARAARAASPHARAAALGAMQRPPLDGPVDLRPG